MLTKFLLVIVFMTGDGSRYDEVVGLLDSAKECAEAKDSVLALARQARPKDSFFFATCVPPRPLHAADV